MLYFKYLLFFIILFAPICASDSNEREISEIKKKYAEWNPVIDKDFDKADIVYYCSHSRSAKGRFYNSLDTIRQNELECYVTYFVLKRKDLGYYLKKEIYGDDSSIFADYYFNSDGKLYFIYWRMNTFMGMDCAVTVIRRVYFDSEGNQIKQLEKVYKMNTDIEMETSFLDPGVDFKSSLYDMDFYDSWKAIYGDE